MNDYLPQDQGWMAPTELDELRYAAEVQTKGLPGGILELGIWKGLSTSALRFGGVVTCVDNFGGNPEQRYSSKPYFLENMNRLHALDRVRLLEMNTRDALAQLQGDGERFRVILVDADHAEEPAYLDMMGAWALLVPGGYLFIDDLNWQTVDRARRRFERMSGTEFMGGPKLAHLVKL